MKTTVLYNERILIKYFFKSLKHAGDYVKKGEPSRSVHGLEISATIMGNSVEALPCDRAILGLHAY